MVETVEMAPRVRVKVGVLPGPLCRRKQRAQADIRGSAERDSTEVTETAEAAEVRSIIVKDPMPTYMPGTDIHAQTYVHRHRKGRD